MQIVLRGAAAGYEAEHTARIFFPGAEKATQIPEEGNFVLAVSHEKTDFVLLRLNSALFWRTAVRTPEQDAEYSLWTAAGTNGAEPALGHDDGRAPCSDHS